MIAPLHLSSTKITEVVAERVAETREFAARRLCAADVEDDPTTRVLCDSPAIWL